MLATGNLGRPDRSSYRRGVYSAPGPFEEFAKTVDAAFAQHTASVTRWPWPDSQGRYLFTCHVYDGKSPHPVGNFSGSSAKEVLEKAGLVYPNVQSPSQSV